MDLYVYLYKREDPIEFTVSEAYLYEFKKNLRSGLEMIEVKSTNGEVMLIKSQIQAIEFEKNE